MTAANAFLAGMLVATLPSLIILVSLIFTARADLATPETQRRREAASLTLVIGLTFLIQSGNISGQIVLI